MHETYGWHTYAKEKPVLHDDIYDLASVTKVTSPLAGLMKLHDEGKFGIDEPFGSYWQFGWNKKNKLIMERCAGAPVWFASMDCLSHNHKKEEWAV